MYSAYSDSVTYRVKLTAPTIALDGTTLTVTLPGEEIDGYTILIDGEVLRSESADVTTLDVTDLLQWKNPGNYAISIYTYKGIVESDASNAVSYTKLRAEMVAPEISINKNLITIKLNGGSFESYYIYSNGNYIGAISGDRTFILINEFFGGKPAGSYTIFVKSRYSDQLGNSTFAPDSNSVTYVCETVTATVSVSDGSDFRYLEAGKEENISSLKGGYAGKVTTSGTCLTLVGGNSLLICVPNGVSTVSALVSADGTGCTVQILQGNYVYVTDISDGATVSIVVQ